MADSVDAARLLVSLEAKIDKFEKALAKAGVIADTRMNQIERRFKSANGTVSGAFGKTVKAADGLGDAIGTMSTQGQAALHSMRSMAESIALGVSPTQALTAQMNHLTYAATGPGGLSGALKEVASFVGGILTPARLAIGGVVGLGAAALSAALSFASAQSKIDIALSGIGRASGVTVDGINRIAKTVSSAGEVSVSEAREIATAIASTGKASEEATGKATMLAKAYSLVAGQDLKGAGADLAAAFADPTKGVDTLNAKLGAFNAVETQAIKMMDASGNRIGAQRALYEGAGRPQTDQHRAEIGALLAIVDIASLGLKAHTDEQRQIALNGIRRLVEGWAELGYSAELVSAFAVEGFARIEPASQAVN